MIQLSGKDLAEDLQKAAIKIVFNCEVVKEFSKPTITKASSSPTKPIRDTHFRILKCIGMILEMNGSAEKLVSKPCNGDFWETFKKLIKPTVKVRVIQDNNHKVSVNSNVYATLKNNNFRSSRQTESVVCLAPNQLSKHCRSSSAAQLLISTKLYEFPRQ